ncbi:MAG: DUF1801 domain-containing protein [Nitriliruptorales bacterium]|nr:DUF1801 domain-containing protein [Nitriliruptorales bacterium]
MAELKTKPNDDDVERFLNTVDDTRRADCDAIVQLMAEVTGEPPRMWGSSIVGFGSYHYRYASGREGDWMITGFSPRKANITLYIMDGFGRHDELLGQLGKHSTGKSCLYVKRLDDIDLGVLRQLVTESVAHVRTELDRPAD